MTTDQAWVLSVVYGDATGRYADTHRAVRRLLAARYGCPRSWVQLETLDGMVAYHGLRGPARVAAAAARDVGTLWTAATGLTQRCQRSREWL